MLHSIKIKNFRCFDEIEVDGFKRVNFIVGQNATGKTALLEGIRVGLSGTLNTLMSLNFSRGNSQQVHTTVNSYNLNWVHFFYGFNKSEKIELACKIGEDEFLSEYYFDENNISSSSTTGENSPVSYNYNPMAVRSYVNRDLKTTSKSIIMNLQVPFNHSSLNQGHTEDFINKVGIFYSDKPVENSSLSILFSKMSIENNGQDRKLVRNISNLFPIIKDISNESVLGASMLHAQIAENRPKLPLSLISSGINKVVSIFSYIVECKNGIVLIDEIENGLHVSILERFWKELFELAVENNVQLFITSHSLECMNAAEMTVAAHKDDFALFKMKNEDGKVAVKQFSGLILNNVLESDYDFR